MMRNEGSPDKLTLDDGRDGFRGKEVSAEIRTADELCSLIEAAESGGSYFDWTPSIRELVAERMEA